MDSNSTPNYNVSNMQAIQFLGTPIPTVQQGTYALKKAAVVGASYFFKCAQCNKQIMFNHNVAEIKRVKCQNCGANILIRVIQVRKTQLPKAQTVNQPQQRPVPQQPMQRQAPPQQQNWQQQYPQQQTPQRQAPPQQQAWQQQYPPQQQMPQRQAPPQQAPQRQMPQQRQAPPQQPPQRQASPQQTPQRQAPPQQTPQRQTPPGGQTPMRQAPPKQQQMQRNMGGQQQGAQQQQSPNTHKSTEYFSNIIDPNRKMETGMLVWGGFMSKKKYVLHEGQNWIGRFDQMKRSDVMVNDDFMSRRSACIEVVSSKGAYSFKFTVFKTLNPVKVNGREIAQDQSVYLNYEDYIVMGKTTFTFKQMKK